MLFYFQHGLSDSPSLGDDWVADLLIGIMVSDWLTTTSFCHVAYLLLGHTSLMHLLTKVKKKFMNG